jgi:hypothetical protein
MCGAQRRKLSGKACRERSEMNRSTTDPKGQSRFGSKRDATIVSALSLEHAKLI